MQINMLDKERWYSAVSAYGDYSPFSIQSTLKLSLRNNSTMNQMTSLILSSHGRYVYAENGFDMMLDEGVITINAPANDIEFSDSGASLKDAFRNFIADHDMSKNQPIHLAKRFTKAPVYNTWIELTFNQNQNDILHYAQNLFDNGFPAGTLIIDDGWSDYYGKWSFSKERFENAAEMIKQLKHMGFNVMLWVVPYISPDTVVYRYLWDKGYLLAENENSYMLRWWNGTSACLDMRNAGAVSWIKEQLNKLMDIGIDGFKFDGGDSLYYLPEHEPDVQCHAWARLASEFEFNEIRADFNTQGMSIMERLSDKKHEWGNGGIASLIPDALALGLGGHPILSPDMIGGGEYKCFIDLDDKNFDRELLLKNTAIAMMMPVVQFSVNPARIYKEGLPVIHRLLQKRVELNRYYEQLLSDSEITKEPIIRYMEYEYPHCGLSDITDQFMLGSQYLIAPIYTKYDTSRMVCLPPGKWKDEDGNILGDALKCINVESKHLLGLYKRIV